MSALTLSPLNLKDGFQVDNQYAVKDDDNIKIII
jgi:hypothetical protein